MWSCDGLLITYSFASRSFNLMVCFLNQILFTMEFLKEVFWGPSFFLSSLMMCLVPFVSVRLSPIPMKQWFLHPQAISMRDNLSQSLDNLYNYFRDNEFIFNLKKEKSEIWGDAVLYLLTVESISYRRQVKLSANSSPIQTTSCYKTSSYFWTLNLETHFHKIYKTTAGRVKLLRRIHSSIDTFSAQRTYQ